LPTSEEHSSYYVLRTTTEGDRRKNKRFHERSEREQRRESLREIREKGKLEKGKIS